MTAFSILMLLSSCFGQMGPAAGTLPLAARPEWVSRDGMVIAGSWEPLLFRVRRDGSPGYTPTPAQRADYAREQSPEMITELKARGVNFVMLHCYKGFGLDAERESMQDAARFARRCHEAGLHVGVYTSSGTLGWELLFKEQPQAKDWVLLDAKGNPITYGRAAYRYYWNRNHPDARAYQRPIIRFAIEDIQADLLHFDNYIAGPGYDACSVAGFREYLRKTFSDDRLREMGVSDVHAVNPPDAQASATLRNAWLDYSCAWLAESYRDLTQYARTLRPDVLMECNPGGPQERITPPVDHGRLLSGGEAFWDEGNRPGLRDGRLRTRIRTYKVARVMNDIALAYTTTPLEAAEAMAFNLDALGCIGWFEYGRLVDLPAIPASTQPVSTQLDPFVRFFHQRRDLLHDATVVADVAVLRSFSSQVFADASHARLTAKVEQACIEQRIPFQIIYDQQLGDLRRYRVLALAGCIALSDQQVRAIRDYVQAGGRMCVLGPAATHDEWMIPRTGDRLGDLPPAAMIRAGADVDPAEILHRARAESASMDVAGPLGLCAELTEQPGRRLLHLVNYRDAACEGVVCRVTVPPGRSPRQVTLTGPGEAADTPLPFEIRDGMVHFTIPTVQVYRIAAVSYR